MSRTLSKVLFVAALAVPAFASASSAAATTWTSNGSAGGTPFTATAPATKIQVNASTAVGIVCNTSSGTGVAYGPGPNALSVTAEEFTPSFSNCTAGGLSATLSAGGFPPKWFKRIVSAVGSVVSWVIRNVHITVTIPALPGCTITITSSGGSGAPGMNASYNNVTSQETVSSSGQTLTASWTAACTIFATRPGSAPAVIGSNATPPGNFVYTVTSAFKPQFTVV